MRNWIVGVGLLATSTAWGTEPDRSAAQRGREALFTRHFAPANISRGGYDNLWKTWGLKEKPADFSKQVRDRYGLHEAPYDNGDLPMGLRPAPFLLGKGVGSDCMLCHAGSLFGKPVIGLGNHSLDLHAMFEDMSAVQGLKLPTPFPLSNVRGTTESAATAIYLMQFRDDDLNLRPPVKVEYSTTTCEDVPAWWLMKKKKTMYHTGSHPSWATRPLMSFMISPLNSAETIKKEEPTFRDIRQYLLSLEAPKYPFAIDAKKAEAGKKVFEDTCARCHGTYGPDGEYPNKVIDVETVGTDPNLATGFSEDVDKLYAKNWFSLEKGPNGETSKARATRGYQAPPLDGVWATAPYFHNGSAPTLYHVLNSKSRPKLFTRSYRTDKEDFDPVKVGWKHTDLDRVPGPDVSPLERRKVYDTTQPGRANTGHPFGDKLTDAERLALIEYLKTL